MGLIWHFILLAILTYFVFIIYFSQTASSQTGSKKGGDQRKKDGVIQQYSIWNDPFPLKWTISHRHKVKN